MTDAGYQPMGGLFFPSRRRIRLRHLGLTFPRHEQETSMPTHHPPSALQYGSVCSGIKAVSLAWQPLGLHAT